ncbi:PREDICTED: 2'-5'-oligoadenylate synthase 1A-like [Amphimedon queenslandica]|uniref:Polymerase nucleotidyl transferase domain-containing protein n=1 Tax=Amphimedon queenslandica TaxID=400682 RepID=A0A1X7VHZ1_AMPQE|nr:PREDICTED: 2'-5'-oligoadenylate synthase 1A-like [Amphimedon queenslandica]|eukprot:XP_019848668.1 PREDICTED: 2'-5'-oligoadenylate synthase 1A-like [Amphimedon queenslandica]
MAHPLLGSRLIKKPLRKARKAVNRIATVLQAHLHKDAGIVVSEIIEGGSLGQGTCVPMKFDVDLVIFSRSITHEMISNPDERKEILTKVQQCLIRRLKGNYVDDKMTQNSVQFKYKHSPGHTIDVDVLTSPMWESAGELSQYIADHCPDQYYHLSAGASKWQTDFIRHQMPRVKEYIKRAKYWKKSIDWSPGREPSSYLMSLLVIKASDLVGEHVTGKSPPSLKKMAARNISEKIKELVKSHHAIDIQFQTQYMFTTEAPAQPRVIDPANVCNNLYETGFGKQGRRDEPGDYWDVFAKKIESLDLSIPFERLGPLP